MLARHYARPTFRASPKCWQPPYWDLHRECMTSEHEHQWVTASEHVTSEGRITYQSCACGSWRVLRQHDVTIVLARTRTSG